jgi:hypothetical protein
MKIDSYLRPYISSIRSVSFVNQMCCVSNERELKLGAQETNRCDVTFVVAAA